MAQNKKIWQAFSYGVIHVTLIAYVFFGFILSSKPASSALTIPLMVSGTYTGNGSDNRAITGVGFQPDLVIIKGDNTQEAYIRSSTMVGDVSKPSTSASAFVADAIQSLDSDGFTLGTLSAVNQNGISYYWVAFRQAPGEFVVGTYTGNGAVSQSISGLGFSPEYLLVMREGASIAVQRSSLMATGAVTFTGDIGTSVAISSLNADGFTVGLSSSSNGNGSTYHYAAWNQNAEHMQVGSYVGNGLDDRNITGAGFQPELVIVHPIEVSSADTFRPASLVGDNNLRFNNSAIINNSIQALQADGFQVGTSNTVNTSLITYYWQAFSKNESPLFEQSAYRFFQNSDSSDVGAALTTQNTLASLTTTGQAFRLRMLMHISNNQLVQNGETFKLQFAAKGVGTCENPSGGTPATYEDVTNSTIIAYYNNDTPSDNSALTVNTDDPIHDADTIINQAYEESNNFTNSIAAIPSGQDGKWDFALYDNGADPSTTYCFRIVRSDFNQVLDTYTVYPEITTAAEDITPPTFSNVTPVSDTSINNVTNASDVSYSIDENLASGSITITQTEGSVDILSPHTCQLTGTALNSGTHTIDFSDTINGCSTAITLVDGAIYDFSFDGQDAASNNAATVTSTNITYDTSSPQLTEVTPVSTPTNDPTPDYTFSSTEEGVITYGGECTGATTNAVNGNNTITFDTLADGIYDNCTITVTDAASNSDTLNVLLFTVDATAPVLTEVIPVSTPTNDTTPDYTFSSTEEGAITYGGDCTSATINAMNGNNTITFDILTEGTYSNCTIAATDSAGNISNILNINSFTIDLSSPAFLNVTPISDTGINNVTNTSDVSYSIDENLASGTITITQTGGNVDGLSPHVCQLAGTALTSGSHTIDFSDTVNGCSTAITLVDGAIYDFSFDGINLASTNAETVTSTNVIYDVTSPELIEITPVTTLTNDITPDYTFSSTENGTIIFGGDCSSATTTAFSGNNIITFQVLTDGTYSNCTIVLEDTAENTSNTLNITPFTLDSTSPAVMNVTSSISNGTYSTGSIIPIQIQFDEFVHVAGIPQLELETGSTNAVIDFTNGSGTDTLVFTYLVGTEENSFDLDYSLSSSLTLNGGTIMDAAGNNANITLPNPGASGSLGANKDIVINTLPPPPPPLPPPPPPPNPTPITSSSRGGGSSSINILFANPVAPSPATQKPVDLNTLEKCNSKTSSYSFLDISNHWAKSYIEELIKKCAADRRKSKFLPDNFITRAEATKLTLHLFYEDIPPSFESYFADVHQHDWYAKYVTQALQLNIIEGYTQNNIKFFFPNQIISRSEALMLLLKAKKITLPRELSSRFIDIHKDDWFFPPIAYLEAENVLEGYTKNFNNQGSVRSLYSFSKNLQKGDKGVDVKNLKEVLMQLGYFFGDPDENYDEELVSSIKEYQKNQGIVPTGVFGPTTKASLLQQTLEPKQVHYFKPHQPITKAEFAKIAVLIDQLEP